MYMPDIRTKFLEKLDPIKKLVTGKCIFAAYVYYCSFSDLSLSLLSAVGFDC